MPYTYILVSIKTQQVLCWYCIDLERRLNEHNIGHSKFTSIGVPWILKYTERFES
jgi:putative endonuclease